MRGSVSCIFGFLHSIGLINVNYFAQYNRLPFPKRELKGELQNLLSAKRVADPMLELSLLGRVEITLNGQPVEGFVSVKVQALLAYLAVTGRTHNRESLAALFWGDKPDDRARANLRKALSNLRKLLGGYINSSDQLIAFDRTLPHFLDVAVFEETLNQAGAFKTAPQPLREAIDLYQGDFLAGLAIDDAQPFEEWLLPERERLRRLAVQALYQLARIHTSRGEYAAGIDVTTRLLALEPWQEEAHRQLMTLLARSGQHAAALAHFETCRRILAEELGVEPLPETQALYQRLKAKGQPIRHNLPPQRTPFEGRQAELAQIADHLHLPDCRLLSLVGPGGIGKTRLALQSAAENLSTFPDGVYFVSLVAVNSPQLLAVTIAGVLGCALNGPGEAEQQLANYLGQRELLLVLDNFEHLLSRSNPGGETLLPHLLTSAPHLKLLVTSRERLALPEEWVIGLDGLDFPEQDVSFADVQMYSAVRLFVQHAQQVRANFVLSAANQADIIRLCRLLDGIPLGLELAASWLPLLSSAEIIAEIERDLDFLTDSSRRAPDRHRSMRLVFESSWQLLPEAEQEALKRLAVFKGKFQREAALHVSGASLPVLLALLNKSLLRRDAAGSYSMHELLRQFAAEKLAAVAAETQTRHSRYYLSLLREKEARLRGGDQPRALADIGEAIENIQAAWRWAVEHSDWAALHQVGRSLFLYFDTRSRFQEGEALFQTTLDRLAQSEPAQQRLASQLLAYLGRLRYGRGLYQQARTDLEQSLALADALNESEAAAFARHSLGLVAVMQGEYPKAQQLARASLELCRKLGDPWGEACSLYTLGWAAYYLGDYGAAQRHTHKSLRLHRQMGNRHGEAACLNTLGLVVCGLHESNLAQHPEAKRYFEQNLVIRQSIGDRWGEAIALHNLGYLHLKLMDFDAAKFWFTESLAISRMISTLHMITATSMWLGVTALELDNCAEARRWFSESLAAAFENGAFVRVADILYRWGDLLRREEQLEQAAEVLAFVSHYPATDDRVRDGAAELLNQIAARLPAPAAEAARSRGATLAVEEVVAGVLAEQKPSPSIPEDSVLGPLLGQQLKR
ncbi:MAG: hypothetical protein FOGNACKC_04052 [Anaerolineae bacterium]|nr:hypothetical protein [Anaerolineae bacterium]